MDGWLDGIRNFDFGKMDSENVVFGNFTFKENALLDNYFLKNGRKSINLLLILRSQCQQVMWN